MIAIISTKEVLVKPRTQKFGKILIEAISINPVGDGYNIGISDYALLRETVEVVEDFYNETEEGLLVETRLVPRDIENFEFLESKNVFVHKEGVDRLYENIPQDLLAGLTFSEMDSITKRFALLSYIQNDFLDNSSSTIYGLDPVDWVIYEKENVILNN